VFLQKREGEKLNARQNFILNSTVEKKRSLTVIKRFSKKGFLFLWLKKI